VVGNDEVVDVDFCDPTRWVFFGESPAGQKSMATTLSIPDSSSYAYRIWERLAMTYKVIKINTNLSSTGVEHADILVGNNMNRACLNISNFNKIWFEAKYPRI